MTRTRIAALTGGLLVAGGLALALLPWANDEDPPDAGQIQFVRNATSPFARFLSDSTAAQQKWMRASYWRMRGYPPFHDQALSWGPPTHFYQDLYAIYRDDQPNADAPDRELLEEHPDWVLRDAEGKRLYIPFDCSAGSCVAYAADPGNSEWRQYWIDAAKRQLAKGYVGVFIDNVNMELRVGDGSGKEVAPVDPRTGKTMQLAAWRSYVADFTEELRAALPDTEIVHNAIWFAGHDDPNVARELRAADYVELERGLSDSGLTGGSGTFAFQRLLKHVDWLHDRGESVILEPSDLDAAKREYELAAYFLINEGDDGIASDFEADPDNWWPGWETDLGAPEGDRYVWRGLLRRDFEHGLVLVNEPGQPPKAVQAPGEYRDLNGQPVQSVNLTPAAGAVLRGSG